MQDGLYYKFLDLPKLPDELEQLCLNTTKQKENLICQFYFPVEANIPYYGKLVYKKQCKFELYTCPPIVKEWLLDNKVIKSIEDDVSIQRSYDGNALLPHVDNGKTSYNPSSEIERKILDRSIARNYLLTDGNPKTCFYKEMRIDSIIESVVIPKSTWHDLKVDTLHGVEDIESERISLTIIVE